MMTFSNELKVPETKSVKVAYRAFRRIMSSQSVRRFCFSHMCPNISTTMWKHPTGMAAMSVYSIFSISSEYTRTETEMGTRTGAESSNSTPRTSFETLTAGSMSFRKLASYLTRLTVQLFTLVSVDIPCADRKQDYGSR
jgi:hypothetical protein